MQNIELGSSDGQIKNAVFFGFIVIQIKEKVETESKTDDGNKKI